MNFIGKFRFFHKGPVWLALLGIFIGAAPVWAQTSCVDVGLVTKLNGKAIYWNKNEQNQPAPVQAFMKLHKEDNLKLFGSSSLQLLYFDSGRQETWKGPGTLLIGDTESTVSSEEKPLSPPEVVFFPTQVTKRLDAAPLPLPRSRTCYSGVMYTRTTKSPCSEKAKAPVLLSAEDQRKIKEAKKIFEDLRKKAKADDITPELYYLGVLAVYKQYKKMEKLINTMEEKRPGNATLSDLKIWVQTQSALHK